MCGLRIGLVGEGVDDAEGGLEGVSACLVFKGSLHFVEGADDADGGLATLGFEGEVIGPGVLRIDLALDEALGFEGGDAVADVAAGGAEGLGEVRGLDGGGGLEEERGEDEGFEEVEVVRCEQAGGEGVEATGDESDAEHGTFFEEGFDAHEGYLNLIE
jgi:hypothetical protein